MKKSIFILAAAAIVASCAENDAFKEINTPDEAIGFSTYTGKLTRAENSGVVNDKNALETFHNDFVVWSSKYIGETPTVVFDAQVVNHRDADPSANPAIAEGWVYTPVVFWDKSATKYDFYAASPANLAWDWDNTNKKLSLDNFSVTGTSIAASATIDAAAVFGEKDIMISEDITNYTTYTSAKVNLSFIHLLSRLNIGVRKATPVLDDFDVKLESVKVFNMYSNGKFNENSHAAEITGNNSRWIAPTGARTKFESGVGYETETEVTTAYNYVYQALAIPQTVAYEADIKLDGTNADANSKPYLNISYEIWTKEVKFTQAEIDAAQDGDPAYGKTTDDVKTQSTKTGEYSYTYNLADLFNGNNQTTAFEFYEGWMNTLKITIDPVAIEFDAEVYEWDEKAVEVNVPEANTGA